MTQHSTYSIPRKLFYKAFYAEILHKFIIETQRQNKSGDLFILGDCGRLFLANQTWLRIYGASTDTSFHKFNLRPLAHRPLGPWLKEHSTHFKKGDLLFLDGLDVLWSDIQSSAQQQKNQRALYKFLLQKHPFGIFMGARQFPLRSGKSMQKDLHDLLKRLTFEIPPITEFTERMPLILSTILKDMRFQIDDLAMQRLTDYDWPGGLWELRRCLMVACQACRGKIITLDDLPLPIIAWSGEELYPQRLPPELR